MRCRRLSAQFCDKTHFRILTHVFRYIFLQFLNTCYGSFSPFFFLHMYGISLSVTRIFEMFQDGITTEKEKKFAKHSENEFEEVFCMYYIY